jgi:hypothetical protein
MMTEKTGSEAAWARLEALESLVQAQAARIAGLEAQTGHHAAARATRTVVADPMAPIATGPSKRTGTAE